MKLMRCGKTEKALFVFDILILILVTVSAILFICALSLGPYYHKHGCPSSSIRFKSTSKKLDDSECNEYFFPSEDNCKNRGSKLFLGGFHPSAYATGTNECPGRSRIIVATVLSCIVAVIAFIIPFLYLWQARTYKKERAKRILVVSLHLVCCFFVAFAMGLMLHFICDLADSDYPCHSDNYKCCNCKNSGSSCNSLGLGPGFQSDNNKFQGVLVLNYKYDKSYEKFSSVVNDKGFRTPTSSQQESCGALKTWVFQDILVYIGAGFGIVTWVGTLIATTMAFILYVKTPIVKKLDPVAREIAIQTSKVGTTKGAPLKEASNSQDESFERILRDFDSKLDLVILGLPSLGKLEQFEEILDKLNDYRARLNTKMEENKKQKHKPSPESEQVMTDINAKMGKINAKYIEMAYARK